jgi:hypothetical protein
MLLSHTDNYDGAAARGEGAIPHEFFSNEFLILNFSFEFLI